MLRRRIGIDENGLGSQLGPLIVTSVEAEVTAAGERWLSRGLEAAGLELLDDSKKLVAHGDVRLAEAWARILTNEQAANSRELLSLLLLDDEATIGGACPPTGRAQCFSMDPAGFRATAPELGAVHRVRERLEAEGVALRRVRSLVICTHELNRAFQANINRFVVDLHCMERLLLAAAGDATKPLVAVCGKVGSMTGYSGYFGPLGGRLHSVLKETSQQSTYDFPRLGRIMFRRDADASDALVALASLVGKYVRELSMGRIADYYAPNLATPCSPSGYHDPVTNRFVAATRKLRAQRKIPDDCFIRRRK